MDDDPFIPGVDTGNEIRKLLRRVGMLEVSLGLIGKRVDRIEQGQRGAYSAIDRLNGILEKVLTTHHEIPVIINGLRQSVDTLRETVARYGQEAEQRTAEQTRVNAELLRTLTSTTSGVLAATTGLDEHKKAESKLTRAMTYLAGVVISLGLTIVITIGARVSPTVNELLMWILERLKEP